MIRVLIITFSWFIVTNIKAMDYEQKLKVAERQLEKCFESCYVRHKITGRKGSDSDHPLLTHYHDKNRYTRKANRCFGLCNLQYTEKIFQIIDSDLQKNNNQ